MESGGAGSGARSPAGQHTPAWAQLGAGEGGGTRPAAAPPAGGSC